MASGTIIVEFESNSARFDHDVIEASRQQPVLVDFWAPWCGPCRTVGPVLEKLAGEARGRWKLVKVNTDTNQALAARYRITSIPAMKLFEGGELVAELTGALPEREMRRWLAEKIPGPARAQLDAARKARSAGRNEEAKRLIDALLAETPDDAEARLLLAELTFPADSARTRELLDGLADNSELADRVASLRDLVTYLATDTVGNGAWARYLEGARALREARYGDSAQALLDVIRTDRNFDDDRARRALVALFAWLGDEHEVTRAFRPKLASALF